MCPKKSEVVSRRYERQDAQGKKREVDGQPVACRRRKERSISAWLIGCFFISFFGQMTPISLPDRFQQTVDFHGTLGPAVPAFHLMGSGLYAPELEYRYLGGIKEIFDKGAQTLEKLGMLNPPRATDLRLSKVSQDGGMFN